MKRILNVALSDDAKMTDHLNGGITEHMVLLIGQGLRGGHDNAVTGVNTERIKVLHCKKREKNTLYLILF